MRLFIFILFFSCSAPEVKRPSYVEFEMLCRPVELDDGPSMYCSGMAKSAPPPLRETEL